MLVLKRQAFFLFKFPSWIVTNIIPTFAVFIDTYFLNDGRKSRKNTYNFTRLSL